jgi:hypothetical protein
MGSKAAADAIADARTLVAYAVTGPRRFREAMVVVARYGSEACVLALSGSDLAGGVAAIAAHEAFLAVPGLRG